MTPVWPASGLAFFIAFRYGMPYLLGILPAMLLLSWYAGVPEHIAVSAAIGSILEAAVPIMTLRRLNVHWLDDTRSALLFVVHGAVLGPLFSASMGTLAMMQFGDLQTSPVTLWLNWWLGNSVGLLVVGGFLLMFAERRASGRENPHPLVLLSLIVPVVVLTWLSVHRIDEVQSLLLLYLLIPLFVLVAIREGMLSVFLVGLVALLTLLVASQGMPSPVLESARLGTVFLDVSLLWLLVFTGVMVSSAWHERTTGARNAWLATHDSLTRLINRHEFEQRLQRALQRVSEQRGEFVLIQVDLDRFKQINDAHGHVGGDRVLRAVSKVLREQVRSRDTVSRFGGDEFMVLLDSCQLADGTSIADAIRRAISELQFPEQPELEVSASVGVIRVSPSDCSIEALMQRVDEACYSAKRAGRDFTCEGLEQA